MDARTRVLDDWEHDEQIHFAEGTPHEFKAARMSLLLHGRFQFIGSSGVHP
jgi:hypothetical protein